MIHLTRLSSCLAVLGLALLPARSVQGQEQQVVGFEITPPIQAELDAWKKQAAEWVADKQIIAAVRSANATGPIPGMTKEEWKKLSKDSRTVQVFHLNPTAQKLVAHMAESHGAVSEVFLSGDRGHKIAFAEKTSSYIHRGKAKFDVPFDTLQPWQGKPEADQSTHAYQVQISVPVLEPLLEGQDPSEQRAIGVLVVGINLTHLSKVAERSAAKH